MLNPGHPRGANRIIDSDLSKLLVNWFVEAVTENKAAFMKSSLEVRPHAAGANAHCVLADAVGQTAQQDRTP